MQRKTWISLFSLALLAATMPAPQVQAQNQPDNAQQDQGGGRRGGRGGRGFGGGFGGGATTLGLLRIPEVRQELKVTQDQQELIQILGDELRESAPRLEGGFREATEEQRAEWRTKWETWNKEQVPQANETLKTILDEGQYKRLQEISLQRQGANSLLNDDVAKALKLSDDQIAKLKETQQANGAEMMAMFRGGPGSFDREKMGELRKQGEEKMLANLTDEQKSEFEAMKGAKFDMPEGAFGFGGPGRGGRGGRGQGGGRPDGDRPQRPE